MSPDQEDVIYKSEPDQGLTALCIEKFLLKASHEKVGIGGGHSCTHGCPPDLFVNLSLKGEVVVGKDEVG